MIFAENILYMLAVFQYSFNAVMQIILLILIGVLIGVLIA